MLAFALIIPTPRNMSNASGLVNSHRLLHETEDVLHTAAHLRLLAVAFLLFTRQGMASSPFLADYRSHVFRPYGILHIGRELGNLREVAAVRLLRLGLRIGYMGRHRALTLSPMPGVVDFVAEFAALGVALFSCHNDNDSGKEGKILSQIRQGVPIPLPSSCFALASLKITF